MVKDDKTTPHDKSDHELANTADGVEIGNTAHTDRTQPVGHSLKPTHERQRRRQSGQPQAQMTRAPRTRGSSCSAWR